MGRHPIDENHPISLILKERDMSQTQLARLTGLGDSYISSLIRGRKKDVMLSNAMKIADVLECKIEDIFPDTYI